MTVLFADLTASTELASRLDPEDLRGVLRPFFEAMVEEIRRFDGTVEKFIGDAVMAVFGFPAAHEDDPERAVRAALAMQGRLPGLNEQLKGSSGVELAMRIGINTGEVVTAVGIDRDALVTGEPVNVAARFQALAPPGSIVVGDRTYRDTREQFAYLSLGEVTVKGIERPLSAWQVEHEISPSQPRPAGPAAPAPMVGRDEELSLLELVCSRTIRERRPSLVTVMGPAGIGKSRLCHEFVQRLRARGRVGVVRGRCLPYGDGLTYWPLAEILKSDAGILDSDPPETILRKANDSLEARFEADDRGTGTIRVLLSSIGIPMDPDPLAGAEPGVARELIARSWRTYFESIAVAGPVAVLLEDLHWADAGLLDLVENLAARVVGPVMFLCIARPELAERRPAWGGGLRSSTTVSLLPLSEEECEHLLEHLLARLPAPAEVTTALLARAEGNPFFAQELLRMVIDDGSLVRHQTSWVLERPLPPSLPDTVQGVIASRIDMLPAGEKRVLQDAAVVGRLVWQGSIERLGSPDPSARIDALVEKGYLWERESSVIEGQRELIFNHILTRDVAYASIPKARRLQAHGEVMRWIEEVTRERFEEFAEVLAYHAERAEDVERTARYAMLAGHRSRRVFAAREAIRWFDRAVGAAERLGGPEGTRLAAESALARGEAQEQLGEFDAAQADYERALAGARSSGDGVLEAKALAAAAHVHWLRDRFEEGDRVLEEALGAARKVGQPELLARLLYTAGTLAFGRGRFREALGRHEEALRVAEEGNDPGGQALALHGLCETQSFIGPVELALQFGQRADELFRELAQRPMVYHNLYMVGWCLWMTGRIPEAMAAYQESLAGSRELGNRRDEGFALAIAHARFAAGEVTEALADQRLSVEIAREIRTPRLELASRCVLMGLLTQLGAFDRVAEEAAICRRLSDEIGGKFYRPRIYAFEGWLALRAGDVHGARRLFREGQELCGESTLDSIWNRQIEVQAWEDAGDEPALREASDILVREGEGLVFQVWGWYGQALAALMRGDWAVAQHLTFEAIDRARAAEEQTLEWRARGVAWKVLSALGRRWEAEVHRARAVAIVDGFAADISDPGLLGSFLAQPLAAELKRSTAGGPFEDLSAAERERLASVMAVKEVEAGHLVFGRGETGSTLYIVDDGVIRLSVLGPDGNEVVLGRVEPGDFFGELALLDGEARSADALAEGPSRLLELPVDEFLRLVETHPALADRLVDALGRRLEGSPGAVWGPDHQDIPGRLMRAIQRLAQAEGRGGSVIEAIPVFLRDGVIGGLRKVDGASVKVAAGAATHPGQSVVEALRRFGLAPEAVHSTSWRYDADHLVVTYLAVLPELDHVPEGLQEWEVRRSDLARGTATGPPPAIELDHVCEHALRHLAWLIRDDPVIRDLLLPKWGRALERYEPEPFRALDAPAETHAG